MKIITREQFGLSADPWAGLEMATADGARAGRMVRAAVEARAFVSILGARGSGKTHAVRAALRGLDVRVVEPLRLDRERLHLGDIQSALVRDLSGERPRHSGEARSHQVRRVLGAASREGAVVLAIDDAHLLHSQTVRGLKRLRELSWMGVSPLLGVVLAGQRDGVEAIPEVGLRSDGLWLGGLTRAEAARALDGALNGGRTVMEPEAVEALAGSGRARNWLDLQALADECLAEAAASGERTVSAGAAAAVLGHGPSAGSEGVQAPDEAAVDAFLARKAAGRRRMTA